MNRTKTVLVTGASGFLGTRLCDYFRGKGFSVRGLVRNTTAYPFREPGIALFRGDLPDSIDAGAFDGADIVVHCAYTTRFTTREEAHRVNHDGSARVYELSRKAGARHFVFVSSIGAHAQAESYYGRSKFELEKMFDPTSDLIIRPGFIIGPGSRGNFNTMKETLRNSRVVPIFDGGRQILQTVHIDDLCRAIDLATEKGLTGVLVVAEPEGLEMRDFLKLLAESMGRRCTLVSLPMGPFLALLRVLERLRLPFPITSENLLGLKQLRHMPSRQDLEKIGIRVKTARESLAASL